MEQNEIKKFILSGCLFEYNSYDHKKAKAYFLKHRATKFKSVYAPIGQAPQCYDMPQEIKKKFAVKKIGKLRSIEFRPDGTMWRFKIGNKYSKSYYADDFGKNVKPIFSELKK